MNSTKLEPNLFAQRFIDEFKPVPTDVALCASAAHEAEWLKIVEQLKDYGLTVSTPVIGEQVAWDSMDIEEVIKKKGWFVRRHYANIATARAVLVCNYDKKGIANYIGSNVFMEMSAAFAYEKPIYVLNGLPEQGNKEELLALEPILLNGKLDRLIQEVKNES